MTGLLRRVRPPRHGVRVGWPARAWPGLAIAASAVLVGAAAPDVAAFAFQSTDVSIVLLIGVAAVVPVVLRARVSKFDPFEPVVVSAFAVLLFFVARPLYDILVANYRYNFQEVAFTYRHALEVVLIGVVAFQVGYYCLGARRVAALFPSPPSVVNPASAMTISIALAVITAAALVPLFLTGGDPGSLLSNRSQAATLDLPPILVESVLLTVPGLLLLATTRRRYPLLTAALGLFFMVMLFGVALPGGNRRYLLALIFSAYVLFYVRRERRPSFLNIAALLVVLQLLVLTPVREARTGQVTYPSALSKAVAHPLGTIGPLFRTSDTGMIDEFAIELQIVGNEIPFRNGQEMLTSTVLSPIPRQIWPGKPERIRTLLIRDLYGTGPNSSCVAVCPTYGTIGELYADFGAVSVAIGMAIFGFILALGYAYYDGNRSAFLAQIAYSSGLWVAFLAWWYGFAEIPELLTIFIGPPLLVGYLTARRLPRRAERESSATTRSG
jgi:hypothetical protein